MPTARKGKIARLPHHVREEINRRLLDNVNGPEILAWINSTQNLEGANEISPQNLSEWRAGGFAEWMVKQDRVENIRRLSEYAFRLAKAADGNLNDAAAQIAGGKLLEVFEAMADGPPAEEGEEEKAKGPDLVGLVMALAKLRDSDAKMITARVNEAKLPQKERELKIAEAKFKRQTAELFLKWYDHKKARDIMESGMSNSEKIEQLGLAMFGEDWEA